MAVKKRKTADSWKKKEWYTIIAPKMFEEKEVGRTPAEDTKKMADRVIKVPLREITGNVSHQFIKLRFRSSEVKGKNVHTEFDGFEITRDFLRRNVRRRRSMVTLVEHVETKDGRKIQVSIFIFTARKVNSSVKKELGAKAREFLRNTIKEQNLETAVQKLIFGGTATEMFKELKTMAQIKRVEIAKCELVRSG